MMPSHACLPSTTSLHQRRPSRPSCTMSASTSRTVCFLFVLFTLLAYWTFSAQPSYQCASLPLAGRFRSLPCWANPCMSCRMLSVHKLQTVHKSAAHAVATLYKITKKSLDWAIGPPCIQAAASLNNMSQSKVISGHFANQLCPVTTTSAIGPLL